jgi:O-antigen ligase
MGNYLQNQSKMQLISDKKELVNIPIYLLGLFLPLSILFSNYLFVLALLVVLVSSPKNKKVDWLSMLILVIPALIPILSIFFHNEQFSFTALEVKIPFLVVALLVGFSKLNKTLLSKFKYGFVVGTVIGAILALLGDSSIVDFLENSLFFDVSYISLFIVISIIYLWFTDIKVKDYVKLILSIFFVFALFSLNNFFFLTSGVLIVLAAVIVKGSPRQSRIAIAVLVLSSSLLLYKGAEIQQVIHQNQSEELDTVDKLAQWQCVLEIMKDKELFGVGYTQRKELLLSCYHDHSMFKAESMALNAHNEYLDFFLILGYIGVLGLLIYFFKMMFVAYDNKQVAHLLIIILIALFAISENIFTRQKGVMIISITCLMIFSSINKKNEDELVNSSYDPKEI